MSSITVVGLGPAGADFITAHTLQLLQGNAPVYLRTARHPAAELATNATSFDDVYDTADAIEDVYETIVDRLVDAASQYGSVVYAVPGSPLVAESTVVQLRRRTDVETVLRPAMSFLDLVWDRLAIDPLDVSPRIIDAHRFVLEAAGERGPLLVAQVDRSTVLSDIKLAFEFDEPDGAIVLQRLGLDDERVEHVEWADLDRMIEPDHLTSLWIPKLNAPVAAELARVDEVSRRLRADCPWDREQTHDSLARYAIEETYELLDAIEGDDDDHLVEELGDVLFQVFAHTAIAAEEGRFNIADVAAAVADKLIERHPHVYGDVKAETADDVAATWESNKMAKKGRTSVMDGIPRHLPALMYATKVLKRAASEGVELTPDDIENTGPAGALFLMVDEARKRGVDTEADLRRLVDEFIARFNSTRG
jgi:tetrapyrrole methylase family protein/MazG family protein